jgi:hypothetical protein
MPRSIKDSIKAPPCVRQQHLQWLPEPSAVTNRHQQWLPEPSAVTNRHQQWLPEPSAVTNRHQQWLLPSCFIVLSSTPCREVFGYHQLTAAAASGQVHSHDAQIAADKCTNDLHLLETSSGLCALTNAAVGECWSVKQCCLFLFAIFAVFPECAWSSQGVTRYWLFICTIHHSQERPASEDHLLPRLPTGCLHV